MSDVKWIKITTDMFDNRKIKHLRRLPDGNNIVLIWVMLLTMAGKCNSGGMIFLTENIPYSPKMLADELDFEESTVRLALDALERLNMIMTNGDYFSIAGWEEHQNVVGMEKIREQTRKRVARHRENKKLHDGSVTCNATVTQGNATEEDIEDIEEDKKENVIMGNFSAKNPPKPKQFIPPSVEEVGAYCQERRNGIDPQRFIDHYTSNGWMVGKTKMKDWKAAVRTWEQRSGQNTYSQPRSKPRNANPFLSMLEDGSYE